MGFTRLIIVFGIFSVSKSEFTVLQQQEIRQWITSISTDENDCSPTGLLTAFPRIYNTHGHTPRTIDPARNFTVTQFERQALELGGTPNYYYPGARFSILPPETGFEHVKGYEIIFIRNNRKSCAVLDFTNRRWSRQNEIELELFPLHGLSHYQVFLSTLPKYRQQQTSDVRHLVTGQFEKYRTGNERLQSSASWLATVSYYITWGGVVDNITRHSVEIVFSRPPVEYNFNQFELALVPTTYGAEIWKVVTSNFYHVFENVPQGIYMLLLWPKDQFFSQPGRCLCRLANGACSNCVTTAVEPVMVSVPSPPQPILT